MNITAIFDAAQHQQQPCFIFRKFEVPGSGRIAVSKLRALLRSAMCSRSTRTNQVAMGQLMSNLRVTLAVVWNSSGYFPEFIKNFWIGR
jgi:hypothetical protein